MYKLLCPLFVASNPSLKNENLMIPLKGTQSGAIFQRWANKLEVSTILLTNVANKVTENNRPLKASEFELEQLKVMVEAATYNKQKVVALGNTAAKALDKLGVEYFKLPHPSPKNRKLNDFELINELLEQCRRYIHG